MTTARIPIPQDEIEAFCRRWKIAEFQFFGSVLRDDFGPDSDIDVLYSLEPGVHWPWGGYGEMTDELERILGRKVDLVERKAVEQSKNYIRRRSILSGEPPKDRDAAYLLDMLLAARQLLEMTTGTDGSTREAGQVLHGAVLYELGQLARSAGRVSAGRRASIPEIPWDALKALDRVIMPRSEPFFVPRIREIVPGSLPALITALEPLIPPEEK